MNKPEKLIEVNGLFKSFEMGEVKIEVLKDINLTVRQGEFISIMGPSGSGKSTLLYLMGGLDLPTAGSLKIKGKELADMKDSQQSMMRRKDIGFVFQFYNLIPNLTVEENVLLPVLLDGKKAGEYTNELDSLLKLVELDNRKKHTPRELSGGQQQRVAIARSLINSPDLLLADEPTGNLDSKTGEEILQLFKQINREKGKTIVQVTHSSEAAAYGDRIIQVKDGKIWE